jgi:hypothetical protein
VHNALALEDVKLFRLNVFAESIFRHIHFVHMRCVVELMILVVDGIVWAVGMIVVL